MTNNLNAENLNDLKQWLLNVLNVEQATITFLKKDGTERIMQCTTCPTLMPPKPVVESAEVKTEKKKNDDICVVFDVEAASWRSFRFDSIKCIELSMRSHDAI